MGDFLILLAELAQPQRLLIAVLGAAAVILLGLLLLLVVVRRVRRPAPAAKLAGGDDDHHTPPYLPAVPSSPTLIIEANGQTVPLTELPLTLGRAPECAVVLEHPSVSAQHARLYRDPNFGLCVEDLGSLNGVYVDNHLTRRNLLHRDCRLALGDVVVLFRAGAGKG